MQLTKLPPQPAASTAEAASQSQGAMRGDFAAQLDAQRDVPAEKPRDDSRATDDAEASGGDLAQTLTVSPAALLVQDGVVSAAALAAQDGAVSAAALAAQDGAVSAAALAAQDGAVSAAALAAQSGAAVQVALGEQDGAAVQVESAVGTAAQPTKSGLGAAPVEAESGGEAAVSNPPDARRDTAVLPVPGDPALAAPSPDEPLQGTAEKLDPEALAAQGKPALPRLERRSRQAGNAARLPGQETVSARAAGAMGPEPAAATPRQEKGGRADGMTSEGVSISAQSQAGAEQATELRADAPVRRDPYRPDARARALERPGAQLSKLGDSLRDVRRGGQASEQPAKHSSRPDAAALHRASHAGGAGRLQPKRGAGEFAASVQADSPGVVETHRQVLGRESLALGKAVPPPAMSTPSEAHAAGLNPVAAPWPGTPPAASGATVAPELPMAGAPQEALPVHVEWLAARGGGNARLRLHPPHLGEVQLNVRVRGTRVDVLIHAVEPAAQHAAAASRDMLGDALAQRDLRMGSFDVRADQGGSDSQGGASSGMHDESRRGGEGSPGPSRGGRFGPRIEGAEPILQAVRRNAAVAAIDVRI